MKALIPFVLMAAIVVERTGIPVREPHRRMYDGGLRIIRLADGSELLFFKDWDGDGKPPTIRAIMISVRGEDEDRAFRVDNWIPEQIEKGTHGQLLSAAMSADHHTIAFVAGWAGARDHRGHNGIFLVRYDEPIHYWRNVSWFDVPGVTLGEIAFGPADTLLVTSHEQRPSGGPAPILTVYSLAGQKLGAFLDDPQHGDVRAARFPRQSRIVRIDETSYAILDPESAAVRFVQVAVNGTRVSVSETRRVNVPFDLQQSVIAAFDVLPDGRPIVARTVVENHRGKTLVAIVDAGGNVAEESAMPQVWRYGYIAGQELHGFSAPADANEYAREMVARVR